MQHTSLCDAASDWGTCMSTHLPETYTSTCSVTQCLHTWWPKHCSGPVNQICCMNVVLGGVGVNFNSASDPEPLFLKYKLTKELTSETQANPHITRTKASHSCFSDQTGAKVLTCVFFQAHLYSYWTGQTACYIKYYILTIFCLFCITAIE